MAGGYAREKNLPEKQNDDEAFQRLPDGCLGKVVVTYWPRSRSSRSPEIMAVIHKSS